MGAHSKSVWRETIGFLEAENRPIHRLNTEAFVGFCESAGIVRECAEILNRDGMLIDGGREGLKRHPATTMRISALASLRAFAAELGLTPGSSGRLPGVPLNRGKAEPWLQELRENPTPEYLEYIAANGCEPDNEFWEF